MRKVISVIACFVVLSVGTTAAQAAVSHPSVTIDSTQPFAAEGCGYKPESDIYLYVYRASDGVEVFNRATSDGTTGCWSVTSSLYLDAGVEYETYIYQLKPGVGPGAYNFNHPVLDYDFIA